MSGYVAKLTITHRRRGLLRAIADGRVVWKKPAVKHAYALMDGRVINSDRVRELENAGLIRIVLTPAGTGPYLYGCTTFMVEVTESGCAVLADDRR